jgi:2-oxoglutarate ferredoxin oxidoreductase subunit delta
MKPALMNCHLKGDERMNKPDKGRMVVKVDECKGCGLCVQACPAKVIEIRMDTINNQGYHPAAYKGAGCTACGICFYSCPEPGAITVMKLVSVA